MKINSFWIARVLFLGSFLHVQGFNPQHQRFSNDVGALFAERNHVDERLRTYSRKDACQLVIGGIASTTALFCPDEANAETSYKPAPRPTSYRVDSTQPPTLIPVASARKQGKVLQDLGKGYGTMKSVIVDDRVNLNNVLNKIVFGTINAVSELTGTTEGRKTSGPGFASFVCFGIPTKATSQDIDLAENLMVSILKDRKAETAIGIPCCPISSQSILDAYVKDGNDEALVSSLQPLGVSEEDILLYLPLMKLARRKSLKLLALSPEKDDIRIARTKGLENIAMERRVTYVADTDGFISNSVEPRFRLYAERSLLKGFVPLNADDKPSGYFAERILVHETAATVASTFATARPDSLVLIVAPTPDLRFLRGMNGRIPRVFCSLDPTRNKVTDDDVTTILLNPSAMDTLSKSRYLRLEIGTGPDTLDLQTKVADYLWFSSSPKVNTIPRLMNG